MLSAQRAISPTLVFNTLRSASAATSWVVMAASIPVNATLGAWVTRVSCVVVAGH